MLFYFLVIFITEMSISKIEENTRISRHFTESLVAKVVNKIGRLKFNYPSGEWKRRCSRKDFSEEGRGRRECTVNTAGLERASRYIPF